MHYLYARSPQVEAVKAAVRKTVLSDVTVAPPFMGKAVVWCGSDASRDRLLETVELEPAPRPRPPGG